MEEPKKITVEIVFIMRMLAYSAKKNKANGPPAYSTLNPETNSDSPSVRSNGARFVSAKVEINHIMVIGQIGTISQIASCVILKFCSVKFPESKIAQRRIKASVTS